METIEIITSQNVPLQYELAALRDRILAFVIDFFILAAVMMLTTFIFYRTPELLGYVYLFIYLLYFSMSEIILKGQTLGKRALGLQVVKINGFEITITDYLIRWVLGFIDITFTVGALAVFMINSSSKRQRIGDVIANTTVIKLKPKYKLTIDALTRIPDASSYQPSYPKVVNLSEDDLLLLKETLDRSKLYKNEAHKEAIKVLSNKMVEILEVKVPVKNHVEFLNKVLKDYISLTR